MLLRYCLSSYRTGGARAHNTNKLRHEMKVLKFDLMAEFPYKVNKLMISIEGNCLKRMLKKNSCSPLRPVERSHY